MTSAANYPAILNPTEEDVQLMLACQLHIGTRNLDPDMEQYVYKRRADGIYIIDLKKTWEKLMLAARVIVAIENPKDVVVISARPYGQRAILKFAAFTGVQALAGRFTPGTFTNHIQKGFVEPRVLLVTDPRTDHQPLRESSYVNVPAIAFCHTDSPLRNVSVAIPANNKGKHAVGLLYWLLTREVLRLRDTPTCNRSVKWNQMPDLFFYRDPEDVDREEEGRGGRTDEAQNTAAAFSASGYTPDLNTPFGDTPTTTPIGGYGGGGDWDPSVMSSVGTDWSNTPTPQ